MAWTPYDNGGLDEGSLNGLLLFGLGPILLITFLAAIVKIVSWFF